MVPPTSSIGILKLSKEAIGLKDEKGAFACSRDEIEREKEGV
jgi:hypothetical protein